MHQHPEEIFDFGFTAVDEDELEAVQTQTRQLESLDQQQEAIQDKLNKLYNAIQPLLNNLMANPEKEYIFWPDRLEKVVSRACKFNLQAL